MRSSNSHLSVSFAIPRTAGSKARFILSSVDHRLDNLSFLPPSPHHTCDNGTLAITMQVCATERKAELVEMAGKGDAADETWGYLRKLLEKG